MNHYIPINKIIDSISLCNKESLLDPNIDTSIVFYDIDHLKQNIKTLKESFPKDTIHTTAVKANPIVKILEKIKELDLGAEVASEGEMFLAINAGFKNHLLVFDSPAKTISELRFALQNNIHINADSLMELDRIKEIKKSIDSSSRIGLRINPQVGYGKIESTSVAGKYSKFGIPLKDHQQEIIDSFIKHKWLSGIHFHIGSQGCEMKMLMDGFELGLHLILEINKAIKNQNRKLEFIDIGGGIPVSYYHDIKPPEIKEYGNQIKNRLSNYNLDYLQIITEFGRFLHANSGFILSKVEYVKHYKNSNTLIIHSGADTMLRECLNPGHWHHEISLLDNKGNLKKSKEKIKYHIAGPLCFANDIIARDIELPIADEGDYLVIHDNGAYTFGMWSKYVSRFFPKVIGIENGTCKILKKRETPEEIFKFWSE